MAHVTLTVLTAVLLLARDVISQDDGDDDGTEGDFPQASNAHLRFPHKIRIVFPQSFPGWVDLFLEGRPLWRIREVPARGGGGGGLRVRGAGAVR